MNMYKQILTFSAAQKKGVPTNITYATEWGSQISAGICVLMIHFAKDTLCTIDPKDRVRMSS